MKWTLDGQPDHCAYTWFFMCSRGTHKKVYGELRGGFAFDWVPTQRYAASSAWQVFSVIVFNLMHAGLADQTGTVGRRPTNRSRVLQMGLDVYFTEDELYVATWSDLIVGTHDGNLEPAIEDARLLLKWIAHYYWDAHWLQGGCPELEEQEAPLEYTHNQLAQ